MQLLHDAGKLCLAWLEAATAPMSGAYAFVLSEHPALDDAIDDSKFPNLRNLQKASVHDIIDTRIFVCSANLKVSFSPEFGSRNTSQIISWLGANGIGDRPTLVFQPTEGMILWYPDGVATGTAINYVTDLQKEDVFDLEKYADHFHEHWTKWPTGFGGKIWHDHKERIVIKRAEDCVRDDLFVYLSLVVYRTGNIVRENLMTNGRSDLWIYSRYSGDTAGSAVVELKVLRSKSFSIDKKARTYSDKVIEEYVKKGIRQASEYKASGKAEKAFCWCFDARAANNNLPVHPNAISAGVSLKLFWMESNFKGR